MRELIKHFINRNSWKSGEKLIVFCSDDWGSVRNRSIQTREKLSNLGLNMKNNRFDRYDTLESNHDLEALFEVLLSYKDSRGNHPVITAITNVGNPDFDRIKGCNFEEYFWEPFSETLKRYPNHDKVLDYYHQGIDYNIFVPESHGREHLQFLWWMEELQHSNSWSKKAFPYEYFFLGSKYLLNPNHKGLGAAFNVFDKNDYSTHKKTLIETFNTFQKLFGYEPTLFTPPALIFPMSLEQDLAKVNIKFLDIPSFRRLPYFKNFHRYQLNYLGKLGRGRINYWVRNVVFEPNMKADDDNVNHCLRGIAEAFKQNQPAIISNHRASIVGAIEEANRAKGIKALDKLFGMIIKLWPEVQFITVKDLVNFMMVD